MQQLLEQRTLPKAASRGLRRTHAPLRWNSHHLQLSVVLGLLIAHLWLQAASLTIRNRVARTNQEIAAVNASLERTANRIASLDSAPHVDQWARQYGWRPATQADIDNVARRTPPAPAAAPVR